MSRLRSYQSHSCSPVIQPEMDFLQPSRPESQRYGNDSKEVGFYRDSIALGRFAPVNIEN